MTVVTAKIPSSECLKNILGKNAASASDPSRSLNGKETKAFSREPVFANSVANRKTYVKCVP